MMWAAKRPNAPVISIKMPEEYLDNLLLQIMTARSKCEKVHKRKVPIALKVAPDLDTEEVEVIGNLLLSHKFEKMTFLAT